MSHDKTQEKKLIDEILALENAEYLTHEEYEVRYAEALDTLKTLRSMNVGDPITTLSGFRYVSIDGKSYPDRDVFAMAWDRKTAQSIMSRKPPSRWSELFCG